jgi:chemotaxis protein methyltransferase CheR
VSASRAFYRKFKTDAAATEKRLIYELGDGQWEIPALRKLLKKILPKKSSFDDFEVNHKFPGVGQMVLLLNARRLEQHPTEPGLILLAMEEVSQSTPHPRATGKQTGRR